jgi:hypothetical protein
MAHGQISAAEVKLERKRKKLQPVNLQRKHAMYLAKLQVAPTQHITPQKHFIKKANKSSTKISEVISTEIMAIAYIF